MQITYDFPPNPSHFFLPWHLKKIVENGIRLRTMKSTHFQIMSQYCFSNVDFKSVLIASYFYSQTISFFFFSLSYQFRLSGLWFVVLLQKLISLLRQICLSADKWLFSSSPSFIPSSVSLFFLHPLPPSPPPFHSSDFDGLAGLQKENVDKKRKYFSQKHRILNTQKRADHARLSPQSVSFFPTLTLKEYHREWNPHPTNEINAFSNSVSIFLLERRFQICSYCLLFLLANYFLLSFLSTLSISSSWAIIFRFAAKNVSLSFA